MDESHAVVLREVNCLIRIQSQKIVYPYDNIAKVMKYQGLNIFLISSDFLRKAPCGPAKQNKDRQSSALPLHPVPLCSFGNSDEKGNQMEDSLTSLFCSFLTMARDRAVTLSGQGHLLIARLQH